MSSEKTDEKLESYNVWLNQLYDELAIDTTTKNAQEKLNLPRAVTGRMGSKITKWDNFNVMCVKIQRDPQHVADYISTELCTTVSLTDKKELKIQYRLVPDKACAIFSKYMNEWVRCAVCKSLHTTLQKSTIGRFYIIHCESCLSDNSHC